MKRQTTKIITSLIFLIVFLFLGFPLEISNLLIYRIIVVLIAIVFSILFVKLFRLILKIKSKFPKLFFGFVTTIIAIIYILTGLWTLLINHNNSPVWEDIQIYTNRDGQKIISQFRETSGSIHDFRERLIFYEFGENSRISINWKKSLMSGIWKVHNTEKDTTYLINFDTIKIK